MVLLRWAVIFAVVALVAAIFGFTDIAAGFADVARFLFFLFLAGVVLLVVIGLFFWKKVT